MSDFKKLKVWQKAMDLALLIYRITDKFPAKEVYSLSSQMRRAGVSVPSNIAEGNQRNSDKSFNQFISISQGSCAELETQCLLAYNLKYIDKKELEKVMSEIEETGRMLSGFAKCLKTNLS